MKTETKTRPAARPSARRTETTLGSFAGKRPEVNSALIRYARRVRSLNAIPRRQCVRHVAEILPVVLAWIQARVTIVPNSVANAWERSRYGPKH